MIRALRIKFVAINMLLVAMVLVIVFGAIVISSVNQQRAESMSALRSAIARDWDAPPAKFEIGGGHRPGTSDAISPVFSVTVEEDGSVHIRDEEHVSVEEAVVNQAVDMALAETGSTGVLQSLSLRYLREESLQGTKLAFIDLFRERESLSQLVRILLLAGLGGLLAFFGISVFLSNLALRPVEQTWIRQREFVADASHELKTPLTVMMANLSIVSKHSDQTVADQGQWLESTRAEAVRMKQLVEQMLFLAKSDAAQAAPVRLPFSLTDVIWNAALSFEPVAYERGLTLHSDIAPDVEMIGDEGQIRQLIAILLDNACKYADAKGSVDCRLAVAQDRAKLTVRNSGERIPPEQLARLFERFYRADKARTRREGGYGLGLSIAERIVSEHHGRISAYSDAEQGTTFVVLMPLRNRSVVRR